MKVFLDTCVVMDFLQNREPFAQNALQIFRAAASDQFSGYITAKAATDIYYLTHRCTHSDQEARDKLNGLLGIVGMADTSASDIFYALASETSDFEDAVMIETALRSHADCIVTRNIKDYRKSTVAIYSPEKLLHLLAETNQEDK